MATLRKQKGTIGTYGRYGGYLVYSTSTSNTAVTCTVGEYGVWLYCSYSGNGDTYTRTASDTYYWYLQGNTAWGKSYSGTCGSHYCGAQSYYDVKVGTYTSGNSISWTRTTSAQTKYLYLNSTNSSSSQASVGISVPALPSYTVTYSANGGTNSKPTQTVYYNQTGTFPTAAQCTRTNYTLLGWSTSSTATTASYSPGAATPTITAAKTYYAVWKQDLKVTVSFHVNGGSIPDDPHTYTGNSTPYYWKVTDNFIYLSSTSATSGFSKYTKAIYTTATDWDCYNYNSFGLTAPTGHHKNTNKEWCLNANGTGNCFNEDTGNGYPWTTKRLNGGTEITADKAVTVYANWVKNTWTIHFDGNGNTGGSMPDQVHTYGTALALPPNGFTKTGYQFVEWQWTNTNDVIRSYPDEYPMTGSFTASNGNTYTFVAQWAPMTTAVTFNPNGGRLDGNDNWGNDANTTNSHVCTLTYGSSAYYAQGKAIKENQIFDGWNTMPDGSGMKLWGGNGIYTIRGGYWRWKNTGAQWLTTTPTLTVYAQWREIPAWGQKNTVWNSMNNLWAKQGSEWKQIIAAWAQVNGIWISVFGAGMGVAECLHTNYNAVNLDYCIGTGMFDCDPNCIETQTYRICQDCGMVYVYAPNGPTNDMSCGECDDPEDWEPYINKWLPANTFNGLTSKTEYIGSICKHINAQTFKSSYCIGDGDWYCCDGEGEFQNFTVCPDCGMVYVSATGAPGEYMSCEMCDTESDWDNYRDRWLPASTFNGLTTRSEYTSIYQT